MDTPVRISVDGGTRLSLDWESGSSTAVTATALRDACPCAGCGDSRRPRRNLLDGVGEDRIDDVRLVGGYGLGIVFGPDGHGSGIFSFTYLRELGGVVSGGEEGEQ